VVKIGREGSGPSEFGLPGRLFMGPADTTFMFDFLNTRYFTILPDGKPGATWRIGGAEGASPAFARASDAQGRLYYEGSGFAMGPNGPVTSDSVPLVRYDRVRQKSDTIAMVKLPKANVQASGSQGNTRQMVGGANMRVMVGGANPLTPRDEWSVFPDGRVAIVRATDYHVDWVMPNGTRSSSAPIRYTPIRMSAADITEEEALRVTMRATQMSFSMMNDNGNQRRSVSVGASAGAPPPAPLTDWPDVKPPFRPGLASVWARSNGELWVRRTEPAGAKGTLYDVINASGAVTHQVRVPAGLTVVGMGNGTVYTTKLDEDDLQFLQRHIVP